MKVLDLSGAWLYKTDYDDCGTAREYYKETFELGGFMLPGSSCENGIGKKQKYYDEFTKEAVRAPRERFEYVAPLWLQREITVPEEFEGKYIRLFLERVNIASELWIDGEKIDRQIVELSAPHIYNLTGRLTPGKHTMTLRIDNRNLLNTDSMASGYSIDTQGYWNGVIGRMELQCEDIFHLENIRVYPKENGIDVKLTETSDVRSPFETRSAELELSVTAPDGRRLKAKRFSRRLFNSRQVEYLSYEIDDIEYWDEFNPALYTLNVKFECGGSADRKSVKFGMRTIKTENKKILLNNKQIALRGTIDCAIYPLTGYPPTDIDVWRKNFKIIQSYGLNHVRFHAWCPPDCAFCAADELGLYVSVEMPLWLNRDVCALELGEDSAHRAYFTQEAVAISKTYGNHPSFIMFSNGNENMGDFELLDDITTQIKAYDKRRIYTLTSNFDHPVLPCEDYLCAYEAGGHRVRIQTMQDEAAESTSLDFSAAVNDVPVPIVSFEVGQYCVYPNVDITEKYTGNILPVNFDVIKKEMIKKNVYHKLADYIKASGDLAVKLYKEDIEAALRTKDFGGFELLSLCDYTGQSTATVGILDAFFDSKGLIEPEQFRQFCNTVVPLFKAKRILKNTETLEAELDLYDYGRTRIDNPIFDLKIYNGNVIFYQVQTGAGKISVPLDSIEKSSQLKVELSVGAYTNSWNIYVFADSKINSDVRIIKTAEELQEAISNGGRAIVTADCIKNPIEGSFVPVFWSPVHFPSQRPCGAVIDDMHPIFKDFPSGKYPDYQWKTLLDNSKSVDISAFGKNFKTIVETVPNFVDNTPSSPLFEAVIGNAELLFCGFDLNRADEPSKQLKNSIISYFNSKDVNFKNRVNVKEFLSLLRNSD
ncbi:MAG: glycoside hydrolase family 2 TIM barrel-domain containing protein [bacterium]|nr:glycoside hydrolase family 2 TIM barrel-domain containing protein [bacterium]